MSCTGIFFRHQVVKINREKKNADLRRSGFGSYKNWPFVLDFVFFGPLNPISRGRSVSQIRGQLHNKPQHLGFDQLPGGNSSTLLRGGRANCGNPNSACKEETLISPVFSCSPALILFTVSSSPSCSFCSAICKIAKPLQLSQVAWLWIVNPVHGPF